MHKTPLEKLTLITSRSPLFGIFVRTIDNLGNLRNTRINLRTRISETNCSNFN